MRLSNSQTWKPNIFGNPASRTTARVVGSRVVPDADLETAELEFHEGSEVVVSGVSATSVSARW